MSDSGQGPCMDSWVWDPLCCDSIPAEEDRTDDQQTLLDKLSAVAAEVLWRASGRRYGVCTIAVRPCRSHCQRSTYSASGLGGPLWTPTLIDGKWSNCRGSCGCGCVECCSAGCHEVTLPGPVHSVTTVTVDGEDLDADAYRVDDYRKLVRVDGECWPACQDMALAAGDPGTWSVAYELGIPLSAEGQYAFSVYLCELWKSCTGQRCRLPENTTAIFRQGINIDLSRATSALMQGVRTNIPEVDMWLAGVNPNGLHQPSGVWSPDVKRPRTQTWSGV